MNTSKLIAFILITVLSFSCNETDKEKKYIAPLEKSEFQRLTQNRELLNYLKRLSAEQVITYEIIEKSSEGKQIPLVKISEKGQFSDKKLKVLIFAGQHGNEPSGTEGTLLLLQEFAEGKLDSLLKKLDILIIPQLNPDGGDKHQRRNAEGIDLNRDHLIMQSTEIQALHQVFNKYLPEYTVDVHEYYPYRQSWYDFGWLKQFDIQLGCLTNSNIDSTIRAVSKQEVLPYVQKHLEDQDYSFGEYIVGSLAAGERLRHSTVDINDGRQSPGIQNTFSFIIEGLNGKDSLHNIKRRAESQKESMKALLMYANKNSESIRKIVKTARTQLMNGKTDKSTAIKLEHIKGDKPLKYKLQSVKTGKDSIFTVEEYHNKLISLADVSNPKAYLVPTNEKAVLDLADKHGISYEKYKANPSDDIYAYYIKGIKHELVEELDIRSPEMLKKQIAAKDLESDYVIIPLNQLKANMIILAFEPESTLGLVNYPEYKELMAAGKTYPILRLE
jgi:hypothetical protein